MTFTHRLARRLARLRRGSACLIPLLVAACAAGEPTTISSTDNSLDNGTDGPIAISPRQVTLEGTQGVLFRAFESLIPGSSQVTSIEWTASGGTIDPNGNYSSTSTGAFKVVGRRKGNPHNPPDTSIVVVVPPQPTLIAVEITPSTATVGGGLQQQFSVFGRLSDGREVPVGVTWTATGGTIDASGLYTAGRTAGTYPVIATHITTGLVDTAVVTVPQATLTSITISPSSVSLTAGQGQQFAVSGRLSDGTTTASVPSAFTATGGTVSVSGYYTAGSTSGTFRVIATAQGGLADTSTVTISGSVAPPPTLSGGLWLNEDFSTYGGSTATWKSNPRGWMIGSAPSWFHQEKIFIDTQQLYNGHPTLRYDWPGPAGGGGWGGCETDPAIVADYLAPNAREVWIEVAHKFRNDFNAQGPGCGSYGYKFLLMWRPTGDRFDIVNGNVGKWWSGGPQNPPYSGTAYCDSNGCYCSGFDSNCRWGYGPNQSQYLPNVPGTQWDGLWHIYRVHLRISSSATTADGLFEVWVDGKQTVGKYNMTNATAAGTWSGRLSEIFLGSNSNSGTYTATQTWWGHLKVWTANPGW